MKRSSSSSSSGIGFFGLLTVALIVLKLTGFIDWGWTWILAPIWIPLALTLIALGLLGLGFLAHDQWKKRNR